METFQRECNQDDFSKENQIISQVIIDYFKDILNYVDINIGKVQRELNQHIYENLKNEFVINITKVSSNEINIEVQQENKQNLLIKIKQ